MAIDVKTLTDEDARVSATCLRVLLKIKSRHDERETAQVIHGLVMLWNPAMYRDPDARAPDEERVLDAARALAAIDTKAAGAVSTGEYLRLDAARDAEIEALRVAARALVKR